MDVGVATAGFSVEGGFNARGQPTNNWADWELYNVAEPSGSAMRLWDRPAIVLDRAASLGANRIRISIEWARIQPGFDIADVAPPPYDETALDGYADLVANCRDRGLEPMVTLHHFTHPRWAGVDLWGVAPNLAFFADYVTTTVTGLGRRLAERGQAPLRDWITINEPNALAMAGGLAGRHPAGGRLGPARAARWLDHLLAAHCHAYDQIHSIYEQYGWGDPSVSTATYGLNDYRLDRMLIDVLTAREAGVTRDNLSTYVAGAEAECRANASRAIRPRSPLSRLLSVDRLRYTVDAIYGSPRPRKLDWIALSWYGPDLDRVARGAERHDHRVPDPLGLRNAIESYGRPVAVVENGLCNWWPVKGSPERRPDRLTRAGLLTEQLAHLEGAPVMGYYHWTVTDSYAFGSYSPRYGIYAVERTDDHFRVLEHDALGDDAASAFQRMAEKLRSE